MLKIEIKEARVYSEEIKPSTRPGAKQFQPFTKHTQPAYAHTFDQSGNPHAYPESFRISLDKDQAPYPVGFYDLHPRCIYVDRNGNLTIGKLHLTPIKAAPAVKAA